MTKGKLQTIAAGLYQALKDNPDRAAGIMQNAFRMLEKSRLLGKEKEFMSLLGEIADRDHGIVRARVYSRHKLTQSEEEGVAEMVKARHKTGTVEIENIIDETLLGGMRIEVGDTVIDSTLKSKVKQLHKHLTKN